MSKKIACNNEFGCIKYSTEGHEDRRCCVVCPEAHPTCGECVTGEGYCEFMCSFKTEADECNSTPECPYFELEDVIEKGDLCDEEKNNQPETI